MTNDRAHGRVNLVVALHCEARPLIQHLNLRQQKTVSGYDLYRNQEGITLIVSGVGKLATASACGFLAGYQADENSPNAAWLNIGIAGHQRMSLGEGALVHKVIDQSSGRASYPSMIIDIQSPTTSVITVDEPETHYEEDAAYDMEASVFMAVAGRFVTSELVQIYKVISDNPKNEVESVTKQRITGWIAGRIIEIERIIGQLLEISGEYNRLYSLPEEFYELVQSVHLTATQRVQLETGYRKYYALGGKSLGGRIGSQKYHTAKDLLKRIELLSAAL